LTRLTEEKRAFKWTPELEAAFQTLKGALCTAPILAYPQPGGKFIVDASYVGIGGVLSQVQHEQERVIFYYSKTLNMAERNYCVTRRELLAIVKSLEHFHKYLYALRTRVPLTHRPLRTNMAHEF
jgi:hypothetical protein